MAPYTFHDQEYYYFCKERNEFNSGDVRVSFKLKTKK